MCVCGFGHCKCQENSDAAVRDGYLPDVAINHFRSNFSAAADNGWEINFAPAYVCVCAAQSFSTSQNTESSSLYKKYVLKKEDVFVTPESLNLYISAVCQNDKIWTLIWRSFAPTTMANFAFKPQTKSCCRLQPWKIGSQLYILLNCLCLRHSTPGRMNWNKINFRRALADVTML